MDKLVRQVLDEVVRLSKPHPDHRYEEYEELVELRQRLVDRVAEGSHPFSEEQREYIHKILSYDAIILERMAAYKVEAEEGLLAIKAAKRQRRTYEGPSFDEGFMFDEKK
jgi:predicted house-cleaning noncanonical NTP pyrophosphatase (MazG superfamily)